MKAALWRDAGSGLSKFYFGLVDFIGPLLSLALVVALLQVGLTQMNASAELARNLSVERTENEKRFRDLDARRERAVVDHAAAALTSAAKSMEFETSKLGSFRTDEARALKSFLEDSSKRISNLEIQQKGVVDSFKSKLLDANATANLLDSRMVRINDVAVALNGLSARTEALEKELRQRLQPEQLALVVSNSGKSSASRHNEIWKQVHSAARVLGLGNSFRMYTASGDEIHQVASTSEVYKLLEPANSGSREPTSAAFNPEKIFNAGAPKRRRLIVVASTDTSPPDWSQAPWNDVVVDAVIIDLPEGKSTVTQQVASQNEAAWRGGRGFVLRMQEPHPNRNAENRDGTEWTAYRERLLSAVLRLVSASPVAVPERAPAAPEVGR